MRARLGSQSFRRHGEIGGLRKYQIGHDTMMHAARRVGIPTRRERGIVAAWTKTAAGSYCAGS
jgi:hypothetical protein